MYFEPDKKYEHFALLAETEVLKTGHLDGQAKAETPENKCYNMSDGSTRSLFVKRRQITYAIIGLILLPAVISWYGAGALSFDESKRDFIRFSDKWGNVASISGLIISIMGFSLTGYGVLSLKSKLREAVRRVASQVLSATASDVDVVLQEFKNCVREGQWRRAIEKCDDAQSRIWRIQGHPHLVENESSDLANGLDDLRLIAKYIARNKLGPNSPPAFQPNRMAAVDRVLDCVRAIQSRIRNQIWEV